MARRAMVTRTVKGVTVTALVCRLSAKEVFETQFTLPRVPKDDKELDKMLNKANLDADIKVLAAVSTKETETLYGMDEAVFIANAEVLPPRGAKGDDENAD